MEIDKKEYIQNMDYLYKISMWLVREYRDELYKRFGIDKNDIFAVMKMFDAIYEEQCKKMTFSWYCYGFGNKEEKVNYMKCDGEKCQLKKIYCTPEQQEDWVKNCDATIEQCPHFTPKLEQKSADYYEGFYDAAQLIMTALKTRGRD